MVVMQGLVLGVLELGHVLPVDQGPSRRQDLLGHRIERLIADVPDKYGNDAPRPTPGGLPGVGYYGGGDNYYMAVK